MLRPTPVKILTEEQIAHLIRICNEWIEEQENGIEESDTEHYIFEEAMKVIYGKNIFNYTNNL